MEKLEMVTESEDQTKHLACGLAPLLAAGDIISLTGDLGAGKTRFVQGLAQGLGIEKAVTSPTFTIIRQYLGRLPLYHFDVFRLENLRDLIALGYEDYFFGEGVTVIEWGDRIKDALPADYLTIEFHRTVAGANRRRLIVDAGGLRSAKLKEEIIRLS